MSDTIGSIKITRKFNQPPEPMDEGKMADLRRLIDSALRSDPSPVLQILRKQGWWTFDGATVERVFAEVERDYLASIARKASLCSPQIKHDASHNHLGL